MNQYTNRITCLGAMALAALLPILGYATPAVPKTPTKVPAQQKLASMLSITVSCDPAWLQ